MTTRTIARVCYALQLHKLAYALNRGRKRVITFHNVLDDDIFERNTANGVSCSLSSFKSIIDEVSKVFKFSLDLDDPTTVTITFDDGYNNQVEIAAPYLISKGIPAYLFVSGQLINENTNNLSSGALVIDKLLHWVSYVPEGEYMISIDGAKLKIEVAANRNKLWSESIWPLFLADTEHKGETVLSALNEAYPVSSIFEALDQKYIRQRLSGVTTQQLSNLKKNGWQIGWHTQSHYPVALLTQKERLSELTPNPMCDSVVFSYPYGGAKDADAASVEILKSQGFRTAVSNINIGNGHLGSWYRSRMSLPADRYLLHFELSGLKYLLKYKKLLPKI